MANDDRKGHHGAQDQQNRHIAATGISGEIFTRLRASFSSYSESLSIRNLLWIITVLVYLLTANFSLSGPNPSSRFVLTRTFAETGQVWFPEEWTEFFWVSPDYARIGDQFYSDKAPGLSMLILPLYLLARVLAIPLGLQYDLSSFSPVDKLAIELMQFTLLSINAWGVVRVYDITTRLGVKPRTAITTSSIFAFGTIFWAFASTLFPHALAATILLEVTYRLLEIRDNKRSLLNSLIIGLLLGFGAVIEYPVLFTVPLACMYLLVPFTTVQPVRFDLLQAKKKRFLASLWKEDTLIRRLLLCFVLGIAAVVSFFPLLLYNLYSFGDIGKLAYYYSHWYDSIHFYKPLQDGIEILITSSFRGVLTFSPIILLSIWGLISLYKKYPKESLFMLVTGVFFIFFYAKNFDPTGGASFGPRYIVPALPFLVIPLAFLMEDWNGNALFTATLRVLAGISIFFNFLGLWACECGPLVFDSNVHPIFDICWTGFRAFMDGNSSSFRSAIWRNYPLAGMFLIGVIILAIVLLEGTLLSQTNKSDTEGQYSELTGLNLAEMSFWFAIYFFTLIYAFYFIISPSMSTGYDAYLASLTDPSGLIQRPLNLAMLPVLDLLFVAVLGVIMLITGIKLVREILTRPEIRIKVQALLGTRITRTEVVNGPEVPDEQEVKN